MQVYFLSTETKLAKTFTKTNNEIKVDPYPNGYLFTSYSHKIDNIEKLLAALKHHANKGHCLLKGPLLRELKNESRANSTRTEDPTQLLVLDVDGIPGLHSHEQFVQLLPFDLQQVDYIWQPSASHGIIDKGLSGHLYMLLDKEYPAPTIKLWLQELNLSIPTLYNHLQLNASGVWLKFPLDISACQNDKLIYIAPPTCINFDVPGGERFILVKKSHTNASIHQSLLPAKIHEQINERVNQLRNQLGLKSKTAKLAHGLVANPDPTEVIRVTEQRDFIYLQLAGGASSPTAYYYPKNKPDILYNFLGEPPCRLADIVPTYSRQLVQQTGRYYLVLRDRQKDQYYNGWYDREQNEVILDPCGSKDRLKDFMTNHGQRMPEPIPDWELTFNPTSDEVFDSKDKVINLFRKSDLLKQAEQHNANQLPPTCKRVIRHMLGDDEESFHYFINWLAFILQKRQKTRTAWVITGVEGTGKGLFFHKILTPILGHQHAEYKTVQNLQDQFNPWMQTNIVTFVDEARVTNAPNLRDQLWSIITEPVITIRGMRQAPFSAPSYSNLIFASNFTDVLKITETDRRFNVAPKQNQKLKFTLQDENQLATELVDFCAYLLQFPVNEQQAQTALDNEAKQQLIRDNLNSTELFVKALQQGDLNYFAESLDDTPTNNMGFIFADFKRVVENWLNHPPTQRISRNELLCVYRYLQGGGKEISVAKFSRLLSHKNLELKRMRIDGKITQGIEITWNTDDLDQAYA